MAVYQINGAQLLEMFSYSVSLLESKKQEINLLNVFPVPDGDTGTNMSLTALSSLKNAQAVQEQTTNKVAEAIARGALKGARGNSGVILSQIFRGFNTGVGTAEVIDAAVLSAALEKGVETAYKAVMKPREGTILTVARAVGESAAEAAKKTNDLAEILRYAIEQGESALAKTTEQLEVLKKAGVVDAGGKGLMVIYEGFLAALQGETNEDIKHFLEGNAPKAAPAEEKIAFTTDQEIKFSYCTEFIIDPLKEGVGEKDALEYREFVSSFGDCAVVVHDVGMIKVHVHSNEPDKVLHRALQLGDLVNIKIENMRVQHREMLGITDAAQARKEEPAERQPIAMVAVASGEGIKNIFKDLRADGFVEGGQTMNPSAEDIAQAVESVNADTVFVLPNNSNIILAATQAAELVSCKLVVIPSKTIPQGISAALAFDPEGNCESVEADMIEAIGQVHSGQVTYAVRDSEIDGAVIKQGDIIGINEHGIEAVGANIEDTTAELVKMMVTEHGGDMVCLYYGEDITAEDAEKLKERLSGLLEEQDVEVYEGGQNIYYYLVSVE